VLLGMANGMALGSMTIYTYDIVPHHSRAQLQAMRRTVGEIGSFTGPLLGGIIVNFFSAGISFLFFAPLHLLSAFLLIVVAKESLPKLRTKQD
jgi:MFS family permease